MIRLRTRAIIHEFSRITNHLRSDDLKPYVLLLGGSSRITRKGERIDFIRQALLNRPTLHLLWEQMDLISRRAISVAFHAGGEFDQDSFVTQFGGLPVRSQVEESGQGLDHPLLIIFDLFVINGHIPDDLMPHLAEIALPLERFQLQGTEETPTGRTRTGAAASLIVVETEEIGRTDLLTYLQLMDQQQLRFSEKNKELTAAAVRKLTANLAAGDFRPEAEKTSVRTTIRPNGLALFARESRNGHAHRQVDPGRSYLLEQAGAGAHAGAVQKVGCKHKV